MNLANDIPIGVNMPHEFNVIVEIKKDTNVKYEYCPKMEVFKVARCLNSSFVYPSSYGFIPQTLAEDGDHMDMVIYNNHGIDRGALVEVYPVGALHMIDDGELDLKVITVPVWHGKKQNYNTIADLDQDWYNQLVHFFQHYKELEGKHVEIKDKPLNVEETKEYIRKAHMAWALEGNMRVKTAKYLGQFQN